jgi:hypothetical protein
MVADTRLESGNTVKPIDDEEVRLRAFAVNAGHLKLATWGEKSDLQEFKRTGRDKFKQ